MRGMLLQHLGRHGLAVEPLLQVVERRHGLLAAHQKLAVEHAVEVDGLDDVGKGAGDVLAGAAIEPLHAARGGDLHADAVPFPFGAEMGGVERVELGAVDGIGQHRRQEGAAGIAAGPGRARQQPVEQRPVGGGEAVPDLLHLIDRLAADIGSGLLGEPCRDADAQRAGQELQERPAARRIEGVQPALQDGRRLGLRGALQGFDHFAERGRRPGGRIGLPDQRQGLGEVADIVVGEVEQLRRRSCPRRSRAAARAWRRGSRARRSGRPAPSRGRDRASRADRSRSAAAWRCAPAGRTGRREGRQRPALGAFFLAAGQMQRLGVDADRARIVHQRLLAAVRHPDLGRADILEGLRRARASRHDRR